MCLELQKLLNGFCQISTVISICLPFGSRCKQHNCCNIYLKSELVTGQLQNQLSQQNFQAVPGQLFLYEEQKCL